MIRNERPVRRFLAPRRPGCQALLLIAASLFFALAPVRARADISDGSQHLKSPDGRIEVTVIPGPRLTYDVAFQGKALVTGATLAMDIEHQKLGVDPRIEHVERASVDRKIEPVVRQKAAVLSEKYNQLRLAFAGHFAVTFRAYDQGVAYRFETSLPQAQVKVYGEEATFASRPSGAPACTSRRRRASSRTTSGKFTRVRLGTLRRRRWPASRPSSRRRSAPRSRSPSPTSRTTPACGCAAPAARR